MPRHTVLLCCTASVGEYAFSEIELTTNQQFNGLVIKDNFSQQLLPKYLFCISSHFKDELLRLSGKTSFDFVAGRTLKTIQIPLPPLPVQKEIVAEIEGYQKVIDGARAVVDNYRPHISVDPEWPKCSLGELTENLDSRRVPVSKGHRKSGPFPYYGASGIVDYVDDYIFDEDIMLISEDGANLLARSTPIAFSVSGQS